LFHVIPRSSLQFLFAESQEQLMDVYERLDDISADTAEARAAWILHGLGFTKEMQAKKTKDFSGECQVMITNKSIYLQFVSVCLAVLGRVH
jgi:ATPase subunit of ABC transporter with duplicated ATPase domains